MSFAQVVGGLGENRNGMPSEKSFEQVLAEATKRGSNIVPGCVLAAIDRNGEIFYSNSSGYRSCAPDAPPIDPNGTFWIASCTKLIASICALQCVERGQVTLDEDISRIIPELKNPQIVELDRTAEHGYTLRPAKGFVTLRQLITHTSGVGYTWMNEALTAWREHVGPSAEELRGKVTKTFTTPLLFEPGEGWVYGGGLDWAGIMAVRLNGSKTLGNYMEEHIFKPLGMTSTTFDIDTRPDIEERLVQTSRREEDGTLVVHGEPVFIMKVEEHSGGGGLWSSVPDYIKVLGDLLKDEPKLLKKETVEELMFQPQIKSSNPALQSLVNARSATAANAVAVDAGINHGLGGMLLTKDAEATGLPKETLSWGGLPNLKWFCNRRLGIAGMYASQLLPPGDPQSIELSSAFSNEIVRLARQRQINGA